MPGLITKRTQKRWRASISVNGKVYQRLFPDDTKKSFRKAVTWETERRKAVEIEKTVMDCLTILDWANEYLDFCAERYVNKTYMEKKSAFKRLMKAFPQDCPLTEVSVPHVMKFLRLESQTRSGNAANKDRKNLASAWEWGRKYLSDFPKDMTNPIREVDKFPSIRSPRYVPPEEDFWKVYAIAEGQDQIMLLTFLHLAARRKEVFNIKWSDVDFSGNRIQLWTRKREGGNLEADWLPITSDLRAALLNWWELRPVKKSEYVFVCLAKLPCLIDRYGKPFVVRNKFMPRICKKANVKHFGFHAIRHLTASILYHKGNDVSLIQALLRHKNPTTTNAYLRSLGLEFVRKGLEANLKGPAKIINISVKKEARV